MNINGSPRKFFYNLWKGSYTGMDIAPGKGVDRIGYIHFEAPGQYDVVLSTEMLEHDQYWNLSLKAMYDNLKPGGLLIITCAGPHRAPHGVSWAHPLLSPATNDYYRNLSMADFMEVLPPELFSPYRLRYANGMEDLQFMGIKLPERTPTSKEIYQKLMDTKKS